MNEEQKCRYSVDGFIGDMRFTHFCKLPWDHSGVHEFHKFTSEEMMKPLPPTAEQTSIARFNALADQIRELRELLIAPDGLLSHRQRVEKMLEEIKNAQMNIAVGINKIPEIEQQHYENLLRLVSMQWDSLSKAIKPRAVAKKKAAPLVGKKGTGRKG